MNFATQSELWLSNLRTRKRRPAKPATLSTFGSYVKNQIVPVLGQQELADFGNAQMRDFVAHLTKKELSPKAISEVSNAVKQIISSVLDSNGDEVFPRKWNAEFIDSPIVSDQHCPIVSKDQIEKAIANASENDAALYLLLAASGLRISEALAIRIGHSETSSCLTDGAITVRTSIWRGQEGSPKTPSATRTVEIAKPVADRLQKFAGKRTGFLFGNGIPAKQTTLRSRSQDRIDFKQNHLLQGLRYSDRSLFGALLKDCTLDVTTLRVVCSGVSPLTRPDF